MSIRDSIKDSTKNIASDIARMIQSRADTNLSNLSEKAEEVLDGKFVAQNMYETGAVLTDTWGYNQLVDMAHSTFDSSKLTVIGEPTITEDGIASGFNASNNVSKDINIPSTFQTFTFRGKAVISGIGTSIENQVFLNSSSGCRCHMNLDGTSFSNFSGNGFVNTIDNLALRNGDEIDVKFHFDNTNYTNTLTLTVNGETTYTKTTTYTAETAPINIQRFYVTLSGYPWLGSVDLKTIKIIVDGEEVLNCAQTDVDTVEIDGESVEIPYTLSSTGSKIVDVAYRDRVQALYEQDGKALYYTLDEDNNNFTLPMGEIYGMITTLQEVGELTSDTNIEKLVTNVEELTSNVEELEANTATDLSELDYKLRPIGQPFITLSNTLEDDEIWLEGAEVSKTTYAALYAIYGDTYGTPEDDSNFVLPDFRGRVPWGGDEFGYIEAGLPNITGNIYASVNFISGNGAFSSVSYSAAQTSSYSSTNCGMSFNASRSSSIYGNSDTVQPPAIKVRVKTRYA